MLSLAEIDKAIIELWPQFDHKRALMRAYKAADRNGDGFIKRREFRLLLKYIIYFDEMWDHFEQIDVSCRPILTGVCCLLAVFERSFFCCCL